MCLVDLPTHSLSLVLSALTKLANIVHLVAVGAHILRCRLDVLVAHRFNSFLALLELLTEDLQLLAVILHLKLFLSQAFLQLGKLFTNAFFVRLEEADLFTVKLVELALLFNLTSLAIESLALDAQTLSMLLNVLKLVVLLFVSLLVLKNLLGKISFLASQLTCLLLDSLKLAPQF